MILILAALGAVLWVVVSMLCISYLGFFYSFNAQLCGNFGAAKRWKNCPATASG